MARTITKVWEYAGTEPGQRISLTLTYHERRCRKVLVDYEFEVESLGFERYSPVQRWNKTTIWIHGTPFFWTYNLYGERIVWRKTGTFEIDDVEDVLTLLNIEFMNERLGDFGSDPYTTGVIARMTLGQLEILANEQFHLEFRNGFYEDTIRDIPPVMYAYWGRNFVVPKAPPIDPSGRYKCIGWTHVPPADHVINVAKPTYYPGDTYLMDRHLILYACWEPLPRRWEFYTDETCKEMFFHRPSEFPNPISFIPGKPYELPDLGKLYRTYNRSIYYRQGYIFAGWYWYDRHGILRHGLVCDDPYDCKFWPMWVVGNLEIEFDFGFDNHRIIKVFKYDEEFNFSSMLINVSGIRVTSPDKIRPGYTLVGWTTEVFTKPLLQVEVEALLGMTLAAAVSIATAGTLFVELLPVFFLYSFICSLRFSTTRIVLHAVWQYNPNVFIYSFGDWRPAVPYVYTEKLPIPGWYSADVGIYTDNDWKS